LEKSRFLFQRRRDCFNYVRKKKEKDGNPPRLVVKERKADRDPGGAKELKGGDLLERKKKHRLNTESPK